MKEWALVDGDIVLWRCAASAENETQEIAEVRVDELLSRILHETNSINQRIFLSGQNNFRYAIWPDYKANRKNLPRPKHLTAIRDYIISKHKAEVVDIIEADDALGIAQTLYGTDSVICSIDKDLKQVPGHHYNFVKREHEFISPFEGLRRFYRQIITGDAADGIPAFDGRFRNQVPKFVQKLLDPLEEMTEEPDMYNYIADIYSDNHVHMDNSALDIMHRNAQLLYILKEEGKFWQPPNGQKVELESLL